MVSVLFATIFLAAVGKPAPHDVPVAIVGPAAQAEAVQEQLDARIDGGFDVRSVETEEEGRALIGDRDAYGVLVVDGADTKVLVAGFNGAALNGAVQSALLPVGVVLGGGQVQPVVEDVQAGTGKPGSVFYVVFGMVIAGMAFTIASGALTPIAAVGGWRQRLLATAVTAVVVGVAIALVAFAFDALPGDYALVALVAALLMFALAAMIQGLVLLLGPPGLILSAIFFIMIGNAASGAAVHPLLLGQGWRQLSPLLPTGAGSMAVVDVAAFSDADVTGPLVVLVVWALLGTALVVVGVRRRAAPAATAAAAPVAA
ncbi:MAG: hypothetical protein JWO69_1324 [Thermoleophilia bacterium]|nr:hypothetical protein [Thermoleophilia bacterium]